MKGVGMSNIKACPDCDKDVSKKAKVCPHCGTELDPEGTVVEGIAGLLVILGGLYYFGVFDGFLGSSDSGDTSSTTEITSKPSEPSEPSEPSKPVIQISDQQEEFIKMITRFKSDYVKASNELKKSAVRRKRRVAIEEFLGNDLSVQLVGKITRLSTTTQQNAHVRISLLGTNIITVSTHYSELTDIGSDTLIQADSGLYDTVSDFEKGDIVKFTGSFLTDDASGGDYLDENSVSEDGSMTDPEFIFKFNSVEKI